MFCEVLVFKCFVKFQACGGQVVHWDTIGYMEAIVCGLRRVFFLSAILLFYTRYVFCFCC
jgi:hypothetical protein